MDSDKKDAPTENSAEETTAQQNVPSDALSKTPEELEEERTEQAAADTDLSSLDDDPIKKLSPFKRFLKKVNIYFLIFALLLVGAGIYSAITYLNSQEVPTEADITNQTLSEDALKQLANTDASVGNTAQTLTIQGNAIISGQTLMRGDLSVAGDLQTGGNLQAPGLTISGTTNLANTQINSLQVATTVAIQGDTTMQGNLNVAGTTNLSGAVTASQITVTRLVLSGNATLEIPNHVRFSGSSPNRTYNTGILGSGGSASIGGSDTAGTINVNSGNNPTAGCFMRVTFQQAFPSTPHVIISPVNEAAGRMQYYVERDTNGFNVCTASAAPANKTFAFDYFITY